MNNSLKYFFMIVALMTLSEIVRAQEVLLNHYDVIERTALTDHDSSSIAFKSVVSYKPKSAGNYVQVLPLYSHTTLNTGYASGFNDGYLWQGKGINQSLVAGVQGRFGNFEYTIAPQLVYAQNTEFDLRESYCSNPIYQDRFTNGIDYVKRYGNESLFEAYFGQSELAYAYRNVRVSLNTQNQIWGPAIFNQPMMSNNANGFPNVRIGNDLPWNTRIGNLEMQWVFGVTKESDYFNNDSSDDTQIHNGFVFGYEPSFFPGFSISLQRSMRLQSKDRESNLDYIKLATDFFRDDQLDEQGNVNESADQIFSFGVDWRSKTEDFRIYLEWIRGDFFSDIAGFITQPEHNGGYVWGFVKNFSLNSESKIQFIFENANLATWETARLRPSGSLYTHGQVRQGYTNNGQVMGAYIGPGSSNHSVNISYHHNNMSVLFEYYRTRFNDDVFYLRLYDDIGNYQDIEHYLGLNIKNQIGLLEYQAGLGIGIRDNYLFVPDDVRINIHPQLVLRYKFGE